MGSARVTGTPAPRFELSAEVTRRDGRWLRWSLAFIWLATGLGVLHPFYREIGNAYLGRLGLPSGLMYATCILEIFLGLRVALGPATTWITLFQIALIAGFTIILGVLEPWLLADPFGQLAKNLPLLAIIGTAWLLEREGWSWRACWLLRGGLSAIWITEGLFPKILFPQQKEWDLVANSGLVPGDPAVFLTILGFGEVAAGLLALLLRGRPLRWLLLCQLVALVVLPVLVALQDERLWVHPFGPLTKNVPIIVGTWMVLRRCSAS
jgi:hypothetical protein